MSAFRVWLVRLGGLFGKPQRDLELAEEIESHLQMQTEDNLRAGMTPEEARRNARLKFGGVESVKESYRDLRGIPWLETLLQDIRFGLRMLQKNFGSTVVTIAILGLGIGVNAAVFTVTKAALFTGFPHVYRNDRILYITTHHSCCVSYPDFEDWQSQAKSFAGMAIVHGVQKTLRIGGGFPESYDITEVSADTFKLVGEKPTIGRDFTHFDEVPGAAPVAILTHGFWELRYGKDSAIIGHAIQVNGVLTTIIGVMPQGFSFPQKEVLWVPLTPTPEVRQRDNRDTWFVFGRLADGVSIESARAEMETIGRRLEGTYPATDAGLLPQVRTFREFFISDNETSIFLSMWVAVGFVLLIACANLANLMLARSIGRSWEISLRIALGAGRWRIIRQLFVESVMLSVVGGVLGWWLAKWGVQAYQFADRGPGRSSWRILDYTMDYHVLWYLIAISVGTALLFGLTPALQFSKLDVNATLRDGAHGATGGIRRKYLSSVLLIGEIALAVVLLAGAGVMIRSFLNIYTANLGVKTANVLTMALSLPENKYNRAEEQVTFYDQLKTRLEAIPGVESVALASSIPTSFSSKLPYELAGSPPTSQQRRPTASVLVISPSYFQTLGVPVLSGRVFDEMDGVSGNPVVIVNERFANLHWPSEITLGKPLRLFAGKTLGPWLTVVGVVPNIAQNGGARRDFDPLVYLPYLQKPGPEMEVMARTHIAPASLTAVFRHEVQAVDPDLPIFGPLTLDERLQANYWSSGLFGMLFLIFAGVALLLAAVGLYAVIAHSVSQRTPEIGIRMAVGGTAGDIRYLIFRQAMLPVGIGLAIGLAATPIVMRGLKAALFDVSPTDPISLIVACVALIFAAMLGCLIPAQRATQVDPIVALRYE